MLSAIHVIDGKHFQVSCSFPKKHGHQLVSGRRGHNHRREALCHQVSCSFPKKTWPLASKWKERAQPYRDLEMEGCKIFPALHLNILSQAYYVCYSLPLTCSRLNFVGVPRHIERGRDFQNCSFYCYRLQDPRAWMTTTFTETTTTTSTCGKKIVVVIAINRFVRPPVTANTTSC